MGESATQPLPAICHADGGTKLGSSQVLSGSPATATLTNVLLTAGQHTISASYSGDNNFVASQSGTTPTSAQAVLPVALRQPTSVAVDGSGDVFIADSLDNQVLEVSPNGTPTTVGSGLNYPVGVALDGNGNLFITDFGNSRVVEVALATGTQSTFVSGISTRRGVAVYDGFVFISDFANNLVLAVAPPTHRLGQLEFPIATDVNAPLGTAVDGQGDVFIADAGDNRVLEVKPDGSQTTVGSGLSSPEGVAVDAYGDVFIADSGNNRVVEVKAYDGSQTTIGSGYSSPQGVAVDSLGDVFVADFNNNRVVEVKAGVPVTVSQAKPTVSDADGTYNGNAFSATATVAGVVAGVDTTPASTLEGVTPTLTYYQGTYATLAALNTALAGGLTGSSTAPSLPGSYTVVASFAGSTDYTSGQAIIPFTIKTPMTSISGPTIGVPGQPLTYSFAVTYGPKGPTQGITFSINYGDGTTLTTSAGGPSITLDHLYAATGSFTIQVTAKDQNGVVSQLATQSVKISTVAMESDPNGGTDLAVGGNAAGRDTILVSAANTSGTTVSVTFDKAALGTFTPTGHILVYGQGGKDTITLQPYVVGKTTYYLHVPALLYGEGTGGDHISAAGSAANNVLTGHGANEVLTGGQGRDLLIAGTGAATLTAGVGDDILIGGSTNYDIGSSSGMTYDKQLAGLYAIMAEWGSADPYATRLSALAGSLSTSTVHDNYASGKAVADQLLGNALANDWFFAGVNDAVKGKSKNAQVTSIT
jgi:hypothetical protein